MTRGGGRVSFGSAGFNVLQALFPPGTDPEGASILKLASPKVLSIHTLGKLARPDYGTTWTAEGATRRLSFVFVGRKPGDTLHISDVSHGLGAPAEMAFDRRLTSLGNYPGSMVVHCSLPGWRVVCVRGSQESWNSRWKGSIEG